MTIERTHHGYEAVTALPGECKRFSTVTRSAAPDSPPQAQRCLGARGEIIIKRHDDRQWLLWWSVTQPEAKLTHVVSDDDDRPSGPTCSARAAPSCARSSG